MGFYVEVEHGVKIFVEDVGRGRPVVFIHGWPANRKMWEYQTNVVSRHGYRCICIDLRGFGNSDAPLHGYTYNRMADDIRVVAEALGLQEATLIGFSMGGAVCIRYITRHAARRMRGLILAAAAAPHITRHPEYPYGQPSSHYETIIGGLETDRPKATADFGAAFFHKPVSEPFRAWFDGLGFEASANGAIRGMEALRDEDLRAELPLVRVPTTILHGKYDAIVPFKLGELQHKAIPGSALVPFEESGHGLFYDEREKFNRELLNALKAQTPEQRR
ncbi:alpha/beta fold hydrolase [Paenibacillus glycinis]|uniref:Alpha/beta fold hydrolase n=1 Tax=Paenibacillus glycinis TaxID=2697035 RepID=A0ABW9XY65_9BACL|nr:alpha/beta hydrolase [Paenibacillus glycinis]NBD27550.1 alpha/beta fold hydrolase [Paenibacillus glycinis]